MKEGGTSLHKTFREIDLVFNSLTTVGYVLEVFIRLWIPSMVRIFTSAWR